MNNFLPLSRELANHWLWEDKPFARGQAWIDLLMLANYEDKKVPRGNKVITLKRGDANTSINSLSKRWGWDRKTVGKFLEQLESDGMVLANSSPYGTTITIVNYDIFNGGGAINSLQVGQLTGQPYTQPYGQPCPNRGKEKERSKEREKTLKKGKEEKEEKHLTATDVAVRRAEARRIADVEAAWNTLKEFGIKPIRSISPGKIRHKMLTARIREYGVETILEAVEKIKDSSFLQGSSKKGWMIDFDWFIRPNNFIKVLEGKYDDKPPSGEQISNDKHPGRPENYWQ